MTKKSTYESEKDGNTTPIWAVRRFLEEVYLPNGLWLEPTAGSGQLVKAALEDRPENIRFHAVEVRPECAPLLKAIKPKLGLVAHCPKDFVTWNAREAVQKEGRELDGALPYFDVALLRPGSHTKEILSKCLTIADHVAMLHRRDWLTSKDNPVSGNCAPDMYVLPDREADGVERAWFYWKPVASGRRFKHQVAEVLLMESHPDEILGLR